MNKEIWKDVVGYEGLYEVSSLGQVRTHKDKTTYTKRHGVRRWKQRILKEKNKTGRDIRVDLWLEGKPKSFLVHRLVAFAFIPTVEGKDSINHIDGNPRNNNVENLEWCDHTENNNHAFDSGLIKTGKTTYVINTKEKSINAFRSQTKASVFIGKNGQFISSRATAGGSNRVGVYEFFFDEAEAIARLEGL